MEDYSYKVLKYEPLLTEEERFEQPTEELKLAEGSARTIQREGPAPQLRGSGSQPIAQQRPPSSSQAVRTKCSNINCGTVLQHPASAYLVICPHCKTKTTARALSKIKCGKCFTTLMFPTGSKFITCVCGVINKNPSA